MSIWKYYLLYLTPSRSGLLYKMLTHLHAHPVARCYPHKSDGVFLEVRNRCLISFDFFQYYQDLHEPPTPAHKRGHMHAFTYTHTLMTHATDSTMTQFSETFGPILSDSVSHATLGIIRPHSQHRFKFLLFFMTPTLFDIDDRLG